MSRRADLAEHRGDPWWQGHAEQLQLRGREADGDEGGEGGESPQRGHTLGADQASGCAVRISRRQRQGSLSAVSVSFFAATFQV